MKNTYLCISLLCASVHSLAVSNIFKESQRFFVRTATKAGSTLKGGAVAIGNQCAQSPTGTALLAGGALTFALGMKCSYQPMHPANKATLKNNIKETIKNNNQTLSEDELNKAADKQLKLDILRKEMSEAWTIFTGRPFFPITLGLTAAGIAFHLYARA